MDIEYLLFLQDIRNAGGDFLADFAAKFSDATGTIFFGVLFFLYWSFRKDYGLLGLMGMTFARYINSIVKLCACVYRPWIRDARIVPPVSAQVHATGYSFPSGHTTTAAGACGMLGWLCRKNKVILILSIVMILLTMFSRNLLGVHTPQDVLVGCVTGFLSVFILCRMVKWESAGKNRDLMVLGILLVLDIALLLFYSFKSYPMDYDAAGKLLVDPAKMQKDGWKDIGSFTGIVIGWIIEKRFVQFTVPEKWSIRIARFVPGFVLFLTAEGFFKGFGLRKLFSSFMGPCRGSLLGDILLYILFIGIYPMIFAAIERKLSKQTR